MRLGILADVHESPSHLAWAIDVLRERGADQFVVLGDVCESGQFLKETIDLLADAGAVGVWGNHDFGLCRDNAIPADRERYGERVLEFMGDLQPRLEIEGCLFVHIEPWLDPEKIEDLWYFEGLPESTERIARSFAAVPNRLVFMGHLHRWLLATPEGPQPWIGNFPIVLGEAHRHLVAVGAVCDGRCALFDTDTNELTPLSNPGSPHP
jgi:predicted phosphodiesterase